MKRLLARVKAAPGTVERSEMIAPLVHRSGDVALLTYNLLNERRLPDGTRSVVRWNSTVVYRFTEERWRILHSHWSLTGSAPPVSTTL
jgi:ketosteroid isomerase-like protein